MAYKRIRIRDTRKSHIGVPTQKYECSHTYHTLSYYINGGIDPTGEHLNITGQPSFDTDEDCGNSEVGVDAFCNPRTSYWDIVEQSNSNVADSGISATANGEKSE